MLVSDHKILAQNIKSFQPQTNSIVIYRHLVIHCKKNTIIKKRFWNVFVFWILNYFVGMREYTEM